jgi:hypothetical protein
MTAAILSLSETQCFQALTTFLRGILPTGTEVFRGQQNRVPEPKAGDFVVMTPLRSPALSTNFTDYSDNVLTGSIALDVLTVTAFASQESPLEAGMLLLDETGDIALNTIILAQLSGTPGGVGDYRVSVSQTLDSTTLLAGLRNDLTPHEWTIQIDVHGPLSGDNVSRITGLFRSEYATTAFAQTGFDVQPLYADDPSQRPFINAEQQYEYRWGVDLCLQVNPVVKTPQQFADELEATAVAANLVQP